MAEPTVMPSSVDTTNSLVEAARNLEYYINISPENLTPLISILQARRWEKNFQKRYDRLTGAVDSLSIFYIRKIKREIAKIRDWLQPEDPKVNTDYILGMAKMEGAVKILLDIDRVLSAEEIAVLEKAA